MLNVLESIQLSTEYLEKKGIDSPRINAELLLADILKCKRLDLYLRFDQPLSSEEKDKYRGYISRRGKFEPLQYILGKVEFYGEEFIVNPNVLIPRQETEIVLEKIHSLVKDIENPFILDIGTGSGILAIMVAKYFKNSKIVATDISKLALETAKINALNLQVEDRITFLQDDILNTKINTHFEKFDMIISNPPYVDKNEFTNLQKEIVEFEPRYAVTDNNDGYTFYKKIIELHNQLLKDNGILVFELGQKQYKQVIKFMEENNFQDIKIEKDYLGIERVISGVKK